MYFESRRGESGELSSWLLRRRELPPPTLLDTMALSAVDEHAPPPADQQTALDVVRHYGELLERDDVSSTSSARDGGRAPEHR